ncbi:hypothetical protein FHETE_9128 [Fusarium heterosporum]|uniref:Uncharacterized protein n=1 Tax=Fusarium heterosporum TaxID=42747 RepID=A0A8H5WIW1_FUSHE|nr:hypothetical protein FHETE_9128 [Fusarium heterosporum]
MSRIVTLRRTPLPSSPIRKTSSESTSPSSSSIINNKSVKLLKQISRFSKKCPKCKATIVNRNGALKRHIERHAKLAEVKAANIKIEPFRVNIPNLSLVLARKIWLSTPAKNRATGGIFVDGPLAGKGVVEGMPDVFLPSGRIRSKCIWIQKALEARIGRAPLKNLEDTNAGAGSLGVEDDDDVIE